MSVSTWKRSPSLTSPIATPATGALIGTPASISARLVPHTRRHRTRAVGLEDFRDHADDVREFLHAGHHGLDAALGEIAVADLAALRRAHHAGLADR